MLHQYEKQWADLINFKDEIRGLVGKYERPANEVILDEADAIAYLKVSKRCLAKWRAEGILPHHKLGGRVYYILAEILDAIKSNRINPPINPKF
jgi:hypothetical protein